MATSRSLGQGRFSVWVEMCDLNWYPFTTSANFCSTLVVPLFFFFIQHYLILRVAAPRNLWLRHLYGALGYHFPLSGTKCVCGKYGWMKYSVKQSVINSKSRTSGSARYLSTIFQLTSQMMTNLLTTSPTATLFHFWISLLLVYYQWHCVFPDICNKKNVLKNKQTVRGNRNPRTSMNINTIIQK